MQFLSRFFFNKLNQCDTPEQIEKLLKNYEKYGERDLFFICLNGFNH